MKNRILNSLYILFTLFILSACGSSEQKADSAVSGDSTQVTTGPKEITDMTGVTAYYECPMKCEGKKFAEAGKCPVCGMDLMKVDVSAAPAEHDHAHDSTHQHN